MKYYCGIDTGGTFTDCVVIDETGEITIAKRPSTPEDYSIGLFDALEACAGTFFPRNNSRHQRSSTDERG